jgi:HPt (histidine-containing phosphotransfer) domain-containing protein
VAGVGGREALPEVVQQSLRAAFRAEVAARLPHLRDGSDAELVRHDAHTLASSAWVVGEHELSVLARAAEQDPAADTVTALVTALERLT